MIMIGDCVVKLFFLFVRKPLDFLRFFVYAIRRSDNE